jgi:hypothetical protein
MKLENQARDNFFFFIRTDRNETRLASNIFAVDYKLYNCYNRDLKLRNKDVSILSFIY